MESGWLQQGECGRVERACLLDGLRRPGSRGGPDRARRRLLRDRPGCGASAALRRRRRARCRPVRVRRALQGETHALKERAARRASRSPAPCSPMASARRRPWAPARPSRPTSRRPRAPCCSEAGGRRGKAKQLLRQRMDGNGGHGAAQRQRGRPIGASSARCRCSTARATRCAPTRRAADLAPDDAEAQMLLGRPAPARGPPRRGRGRVPAPDGARQAPDGASRALSRPRHAGRRAGRRARSARRRWRPTHEAQREVTALLEREPDNAGCQRDLSVTCDRIGDMLAAQARARCGARELPPQPRDRRGAGRSAIRTTRSGSTIFPSATTASARCSTARAIATARWRASARAWRSPRRSRGAIPTTCSGNGTCRSASTASAMSLIAKGKIAEALGSYRRGLEIAEALAERDPAHAGWQRDLAVSYHKIGSLEALRATPARRASSWSRAAPSSPGSTASPRTRRSGAPTSPSSTTCCARCRG